MPAAALAALLVAAADPPDEVDIPLARLPANVRKAIDDLFPNCTFVKAQVEKDGDAFFYEVDVKYLGMEVEVAVDGAGKVLEVDKTFNFAHAPRPVIFFVTGSYPAGRVDKAEEVTVDGAVTYELVITNPDRRVWDVKLTRNGTLIRADPIRPELLPKGRTVAELTHSELQEAAAAGLLELAKAELAGKKTAQARKLLEDANYFHRTRAAAEARRLLADLPK